MKYPGAFESIWKKANEYPCLQKKQEFIQFLAFLRSHHVKSVLEIGCHEGGTARAFLELNMKVISIDLAARPGSDALLKDPRFTRIIGDSKKIDEAVITVYNSTGFDLVYIDGDHTEDGCSSDFYKYLPLARKLVAFHDILFVPHIPDVYTVWEREKTKYDRTHEIVTNEQAWGGFGIIEI